MQVIVHKHLLEKNKGNCSLREVEISLYLEEI